MRWLSAPFLVGVALLVVGPVAMTFWLSTQRYDALSRPVGVGLENFDALFLDPLFETAFFNTLLFAGLSVPLRVGAAFGLALLLAGGVRAGGLWRAVVYLPAVLPEVALAVVWLWILNPLHGPSELLSLWGLDPGAWLREPFAAQLSLVLLSVLQLGELFLVLLAARRLLPEELYEVCALEGGTALTAFWRITFPLLLPVLVLLSARDVALSMQASFVPALVVTKGGPGFATLFLPLYVYQVGFEHLRFGMAAAMTVFILLITAAMAWVQGWALAAARR